MPVIAEYAGLVEPNLYRPSRQPMGPVVIDRSHPWVPEFAIAPGITGHLRNSVNDNTPNQTYRFMSGQSIKVLDGVKILDITGAANSYVPYNNFKSPKPGTGPYSYMCRLKTPGSWSGHAGVFGVGSGTTYYSPHYLYQRLNSSPYGWGLYHTAQVHANTSPSVNTWYTMTGIRRGTTVYFYLNGVADGSGSHSNTITDTGMIIGGQTTSGLHATRLEFLYFWTRALPDAVRADIERDPYQLWVPA